MRKDCNKSLGFEKELPGRLLTRGSQGQRVNSGSISPGVHAFYVYCSWDGLPFKLQSSGQASILSHGNSPPGFTEVSDHFAFGQVEIDVLTGETQVNSFDLVYAPRAIGCWGDSASRNLFDLLLKRAHHDSRILGD